MQEVAGPGGKETRTARLHALGSPRSRQTAHSDRPACTLSSPCRRRRPRSICSGVATERTSGGVTSFELMLRAGVEAVVKFDPVSRMPLAGDYPWFVLIEVSSQAGEGLRDVLETFSPRAREGPGARRHDRRQSRTGQSVLAHPRTVRRSAEARRRLDQARRVGAGRRGAGLSSRKPTRRYATHPGCAAGAVRPCRRRQYAFQRQPAGRRRQRAQFLARWAEVNAAWSTRSC